MSLLEQERQNFNKLKAIISDEDLVKINAISNDRNKNDKEKIKKLTKYFNNSFSPKVCNFDIQSFNQKIQKPTYIISIFSGNPNHGERIFHILYSYFTKLQPNSVNKKDKLYSREYYTYNDLNEDIYISIPTHKGEVILFLAHRDVTRASNKKQIGKNALIHSEIIKRSDYIFNTQDLDSYIHELYSENQNNQYKISNNTDLFNPEQVSTINQKLNSIYNDQFKITPKQAIPENEIHDEVKLSIIAKFIKSISPFEEKIDSYCYSLNGQYKILYEVPGMNIDVENLRIETCVVHKNLFVDVKDVANNKNSFPVRKIENAQGINTQNPRITYNKGFLTVLFG